MTAKILCSQFLIVFKPIFWKKNMFPLILENLFVIEILGTFLKLPVSHNLEPTLSFFSRFSKGMLSDNQLEKVWKNYHESD